MKIIKSQGKLNIFIIFLVLAILTSLISKLTSTYEKNIVFKINISDIPVDKVIYNKSHDSVLLKLRGFGFSLAKYYFDSPNLEISVKKLKESNNSFLWTKNQNFEDTKLLFDPSVEILNISQDSIMFYFDRYVSKKKYIKTNVSVNFQPGYDSFKPISISNDSVTILGPKDVLDKIDYLETESIRLNNVNSDIKMNLNLLKPGYENLTFDFTSVEYKLDVDQYTEEIINIPVNIINASNTNFNYYPKELSVKYFISIEDYKKINAIEFGIECVFDKNQSILTPVLKRKPSYIKNARLSSNQIQLIILE